MTSFWATLPSHGKQRGFITLLAYGAVCSSQRLKEVLYPKRTNEKKTISLEIIPGSNCRDTSCNYLAFTYVHIFTSYSCPSEIPAPLSVPEPLQHQPHLWDQTDPSDSANTWLTTRLWWMMVVGPFPSWCGLVVNIRIWYCSDMLRSMQRVSFGTTHSAKASQSSSLCKPGGDMQCNWHSISKN